MSNVRLVPLDLSHTELVVKWRSDPEILTQMFGSEAPTVEGHNAWFTKMKQRGDRLEYVILYSPTGRREEEVPVGTIGLSNITGPAGTAEYGVLLGERRYRGKGIALEASQQLLGIAFKGKNLTEVVLNAFGDNSPAIALYGRLGFEPEPSGNGFVVKDGVQRPTVRMRLSAARWSSQGTKG